MQKRRRQRNLPFIAALSLVSITLALFLGVFSAVRQYSAADYTFTALAFIGIALGPLVATLVGALEGAVVVGGLSALGAALTQIGVPKDQVIKYEAALKVDKYLLVVHGSADDQEKARSVLAQAKVAGAAA